MKEERNDQPQPVEPYETPQAHRPSTAMKHDVQSLLVIENRPPITAGQIIAGACAIPIAAAIVAALAAPTPRLAPALFFALTSLALLLVMAINLLRLITMGPTPASPAFIIAMRQAMPADIWQKVRSHTDATLIHNRIITRSDLFSWHKSAAEQVRNQANALTLHAMAQTQRQALD